MELAPYPKYVAKVRFSFKTLPCHTTTSLPWLVAVFSAQPASSRQNATRHVLGSTTPIAHVRFSRFGVVLFFPSALVT